MKRVDEIVGGIYKAKDDIIIGSCKLKESVFPELKSKKKMKQLQENALSRFSGNWTESLFWDKEIYWKNGDRAF